MAWDGLGGMVDGWVRWFELGGYSLSFVEFR